MIKDSKIVRTVQSTSQDYERGLKEVTPPSDLLKSMIAFIVNMRPLRSNSLVKLSMISQLA